MTVTAPRVDNVGSLLRPPELKAAFAQRASGEVEDAELRQIQDAAIGSVIAKQEQLGLRVVTDGEFRRRSFMESFADVAGWNPWLRRSAEKAAGAASAGQKTSSDASMHQAYSVTERLRLTRSLPLDEYTFSAGVASSPVKITLIDTDRIRSIADIGSAQDVYPNIRSLLTDIVKIEREIVGGLVKAGCKYIQIDGPSYTRFVDPTWKEHIRSQGEDPSVLLSEAIENDNAVIAGWDGVLFGMHLCRGNPADGGYHRQGPYDEIAEQIFNGLNHSRLLLEYDTERSGSFESLRFLPKGKTVVLGLVSSKTAEVEAVDELRRRIDEAARYVPLERVAISPQCGFASSLAHARQPEEIQWRKFEALVETALKVWGAA